MFSPAMSLCFIYAGKAPASRIRVHLITELLPVSDLSVFPEVVFFGVSADKLGSDYSDGILLGVKI